MIHGGEFFFLLFAKFHDTAKQLRLIHLIRNFADDQVRFSVIRGLDGNFRAESDSAAPRFIRLNQFVGNDNSARGEIGTRHVLHHLFQRNRRIIDICYHTVDHFFEIVRGDIRGKPHRDSVRAVYKKIGESPRKHVRLFQRVVEVQRKRNGIFIYIA